MSGAPAIVRPLLVALLAALVTSSAVAVVYSKHLSRVAYSEVSRQQAERDALEVEWSRLQIEASTFSEFGRIERAARDSLGMTFPDLAESVLIVRRGESR